MADDEDPRQVDQLSNPSSGSGTKPEPSARIADAIARWRQMQGKLEALDVMRVDRGVTPVAW